MDRNQTYSSYWGHLESLLQTLSLQSFLAPKNHLSRNNWVLQLVFHLDTHSYIQQLCLYYTKY